MPDLAITFRVDVPQKRREELMQEFRTLDGVEAVGPLFPDDSDSDLSRLAYARLRHDGQLTEAIKRLNRHPEIESVERPAGRRLASNAQLGDERGDLPPRGRR